MRTFAAAASVLVFSGAALAAGPMAPKPMSKSEIAAENRAAAKGRYTFVDEQLKSLDKVNQDMADCVAALAYLHKDLFATERRLKEAAGGRIPSDQLPLLDIKRKRFQAQQQLCLTMTKDSGQRFDAVTVALANIDPPNDAGIPRRRKILARARARFNELIKTYATLKLPGTAGKAK
jgi:hypothetical protein